MATNEQVCRAYARALQKLAQYKDLTATEISAGMLFPPKQRRKHRRGFQVFVKVCRYSDELLADDPNSGGLLCEASDEAFQKHWRKAENEK